MREELPAVDDEDLLRLHHLQRKETTKDVLYLTAG